MRILSHEVHNEMNIRSVETGREYKVTNVQGGYAYCIRQSGPDIGKAFAFSLIEMGRAGIAKATGEPPLTFSQETE